MTLEEIKTAVETNRQAGNYLFSGLDSSDIGRYNGHLMFGENDEAFPSLEEWEMIVD